MRNRGIEGGFCPVCILSLLYCGNEVSRHFLKHPRKPVIKRNDQIIRRSGACTQILHTGSFYNVYRFTYRTFKPRFFKKYGYQRTVQLSPVTVKIEYLSVSVYSRRFPYLLPVEFDLFQFSFLQEHNTVCAYDQKTCLCFKGGYFVSIPVHLFKKVI